MNWHSHKLGSYLLKMERLISYKKNNNQHGVMAKAEVPDDCPVCGRLIIFPLVKAQYNEGKSELQLVFECTNEKCKTFILAWYNTALSAVTLIKIEPPNLTVAIVPETISQISPEFASIYR